MAEGMNKAILIGNLGDDGELKYTQNGNAVLRLRLATNESYKDKNGERQDKTEWHTVVVWGRRAEGLNKFLAKGMAIAVEGRIEHRQWEDRDGNKRVSDQVVATDIKALGGGSRGGGAGAPQGGAGPEELGGGSFGGAGDFDDSDDIPFVRDATWWGGR